MHTTYLLTELIGDAAHVIENVLKVLSQVNSQFDHGDVEGVVDIRKV